MGKSAAYVDFQQRASEFKVGDVVKPFQARPASYSGTVQAVWPAIGMVDVEWPHGSERVPVEELQRMKSDSVPPAVGHDNVPGGAGTVSVPGGPVTPAGRVATAFVKKALYWAAADRQYRATRAELDSGSFHCPKCKESMLKKCIYRREDGQSERLFGCPDCLFLVTQDALLNHPDTAAKVGFTPGQEEDRIRGFLQDAHNALQSIAPRWLAARPLWQRDRIEQAQAYTDDALKAMTRDSSGKWGE